MMDWLHTTQSLDEIDYYVRQSGDRVVLYFYMAMAFSMESFGYGCHFRFFY